MVSKKDCNMAYGPIPRENPLETREDAGKAFIDLGAQTMIPMHWGTYYMGIEHPLEPIKRIVNWWQRYTHQLKDKHLLCMKVGQQLALRSLGFGAHRGLVVPTQLSP